MPDEPKEDNGSPKPDDSQKSEQPKSSQAEESKSENKQGDAGEKDGKKEEEKPKKKFKWTPLKVIGLVVIGIGVITFAVIYISYALSHETTDDAYTTGFIHQISSRVTSNVTQLLIQDNQYVHQGQVLLRLDPRDFQVQVDRTRANYNQALADYTRVYRLRNDVAISKEDFDQTTTNLEVAKAALEDANDQLSYCTITAPTDGYIGNRTVDVGNRVTVGGSLMTVVQDVWVIANYKETQLGKMKERQQVEITVDAIPKVTFRGHIDSFSPGTGSTFALLPPDNATGNFTKIVQRVPVKVFFEVPDLQKYRDRLVPGLSVETAIDLNAPLVQVNEPVRKLER